MKKSAAALESALVDELEKEKYRLTEKVKNLELSNSSLQAEARRKDERIDQAQAKLQMLADKLKAYQEKHKLEARLVADLFRWVREAFQTVSSHNHMFLEFFTRVFHSFVTLSPVEFSELRLFDPRPAIENILSNFARESEQKQLFKVLKLNKLREVACSDLPPNPNLEENMKLVKTLHTSILKKLEGGDNQDLLGLQSQFETHKNLMIENASLLRAAGRLEPPSSRLEDSILLGDATDRSVHKNGKMSAARDMSFCDFENQSILEDFPRTGRRHSHAVNNEPNIQMFLREDANLRVSLAGQSMFNSRLEDKVSEIVQNVDVRKRELKNLKLVQADLERILEDSFIQLQDLETEIVYIQNHITVTKLNIKPIQEKLKDKQELFNNLLAKISSQPITKHIPIFQAPCPLPQVPQQSMPPKVPSLRIPSKLPF